MTVKNSTLKKLVRLVEKYKIWLVSLSGSTHSFPQLRGLRATFSVKSDALSTRYTMSLQSPDLLVTGEYSSTGGYYSFCSNFTEHKPILRCTLFIQSSNHKKQQTNSKFFNKVDYNTDQTTTHLKLRIVYSSTTSPCFLYILVYLFTHLLFSLLCFSWRA